MPPELLMSFKPTITVFADGDDLLAADEDRHALRLIAPAAPLRRLLEALQAGAQSAASLCRSEPGDPDAEILPVVLQRLADKGFLRLTWMIGERRLATLEPSATFRVQEPALTGRFRLSRFAFLRREDDAMIVESGLGHAHLVLHDEILAGLTSRLARPYDAEELSRCTPESGDEAFSGAAATTLLWLLVNAGAAFACDEQGQIEEDQRTALRQWEFHDLLFHSRSRAGRYGRPFGVPFRFLGKIPALPASKPPMSATRIALPRPDLEALARSDPPFSAVSESRASLRPDRRLPLTLDQLAEFLYRSLRMRKLLPAQPEKGHHYEASFRPCCSGGAIHPLEAYLAVQQVEGLAPGFYHYDARDHVLEHLSGLTPPVQRLLADTSAAMNLAGPADVSLTLAARVPRVTWKYQSFAYALILKDVGALYQQMNLVATAQGLAACAIGTGNFEAFAQASGLDPCEETAVGEFVLCGRPA
ncbi:MAG: biosynthesis dehydrogenase protein [Proteobacteria bacterium]|nr:biosynthesis dehydrogenase protein [Pseudomonadota bacterium]